MRRNLGFTLAEVLITLGIIGVVAALVMPGVINSTKGAQFTAAFKKTLSAMSQAVALNVVQDGESFADLDGQGVLDLFKNRMNIVKTETGLSYEITGAEELEDSGMHMYETVLLFSDGTVFISPSLDSRGTIVGDCVESNYLGCYGWIDVNGTKGPNKVIQCKNPADTANDTHIANAPDCEIDTPTDVYPVALHDQVVVPRTNAARAVLYSGK